MPIMKKNIYALALLWLAAGLSAGCGKKRMAVSEYQRYITDAQNGLKIEREQNNLKTEFSLEPLEWQALKASLADKAVDREKFDRYKEENKGMLQFSFKVYLPEKLPLYDYFATKYENPQEALLYAEYDMKDDFRLATAPGDSLPAIAVHHQPSFGLKPYEEFLVLFKSADPHIQDKPLSVHYHDHLFGLHTLAYTFDEATMANIPVLKIN